MLERSPQYSVELKLSRAPTSEREVWRLTGVPVSTTATSEPTTLVPWRKTSGSTPGAMLWTVTVALAVPTPPSGIERARPITSRQADAARQRRRDAALEARQRPCVARAPGTLTLAFGLGRVAKATGARCF